MSGSVTGPGWRRGRQFSFWLTSQYDNNSPPERATDEGGTTRANHWIYGNSLTRSAHQSATAAQLASVARLCYAPPMPDDLYDRDVLAWSEHQADLLRRLARGERVNDVDWEHVVEEIEDVGLSELNAVQSYLRHMLAHLLKVRGWPDSTPVNHWRGEIVAFQQNALQRFAPSMRQRIDLGRLYADALEQLEPWQHDATAPLPWPADCPFTLDQLLRGKRRALEEQLSAASPNPTA